jgi:hypothetical protein
MIANRFGTIREAKEYLAGRITEEASHEGTRLTEVERKMLYFSETGWTLPDMMKVSEEFDRDYDQGEYEAKIGSLVIRLLAAQDEQGVEAWDEAVAKISDEDHYILVPIDAAKPAEPASKWLPVLSGPVRKSHGDTVRLILVALAASALMFLLLWCRGYFMGRAHF